LFLCPPEQIEPPLNLSNLFKKGRVHHKWERIGCAGCADNGITGRLQASCVGGNDFFFGCDVGSQTNCTSQ